jgi:apolipoprotein N-acyltransferase
LAGVLTAIAFPPFGVLPGLLGYGLLMRLADMAPAKAPLRAAFWRGWLAGLAYFLIATWWVFEAFQVDKAQAWMAPIAVVLLAGGMGLFWGLATLLYRLLQPRGVLRALVFAGCFCLLEWLRGHVLTGFPWDLSGETWRAGSAPSQAAALVGAYGLGWLTVAAAAAPAMLTGPRPTARTWMAAGLACLVIVGLHAYGANRLAHAITPRANAPIVRVVQARVEETDKYDDQVFRDILGRYLTLTARPAARTPAVVVWSEVAIPAAANDYLADGSWTKAAVESALQPGQTLLTGAYRVAGTQDHPIYFNTLLALHDQGGDLVTTAVYDKFRLVPFGEYMPLDRLMTKLGVKALTHTGDSYAAGPGPRSILSPGLPRVQPLICYESLFPGFTRAAARKYGRASWIVNVSNDAWFGPTYGPVQHLNMASYRAIEEGLPIVRATPTGVSAVIDAYGRIAPGDSLGQDAMGVIDAPLPPALASTPFADHGETLFWLMMVVSAVSAGASYRRMKTHLTAD